MISDKLVTHAVTTTWVSAGSNRSFWAILMMMQLIHRLVASMGSDEASGAGDEDGEGWSQKVQGKRSREKKMRKKGKKKESTRDKSERKLIK